MAPGCGGRPISDPKEVLRLLFAGEGSCDVRTLFFFLLFTHPSSPFFQFLFSFPLVIYITAALVTDTIGMFFSVNVRTVRWSRVFDWATTSHRMSSEARNYYFFERSLNPLNDSNGKS